MAAIQALPKNSVGTKQLKRNAVVSAKVKNGSLLRADFKSGQIPAGPQGPAGPGGPAGPAGSAGPAGPAGPPGSARAYATVGSLGTPAIDVAYSKGSWSVTRPTTGVYCLTPPAGVSPSNTPAYVTVEWGESSGFDLLAYWVKLNTFQCAANEYAVRTYRFPGGVPALSNSVAFTLLVP